MAGRAATSTPAGWQPPRRLARERTVALIPVVVCLYFDIREYFSDFFLDGFSGATSPETTSLEGIACHGH